MERDFFLEEFKPSKNRGQSDKEVPCLECKPTPATVRTSNITHTHIFCSGLSGIQTFMFAMATSILSIISFPPCQICRVSYFFWVDNSQIKNAHKNTHTHIYHLSINPSIQARFVAELSPEMWQQLQVFVRASFALSKLQLKQGDKNGRFCVDAWPEIRRLWSRDDIYWFYAHILWSC